VACAFSTKREVLSFKSYLFTKLARFLLLQTVVSQHVTKEKFIFVPDMLDYSKEFDDAMLRKRWGITDDEWEFIDSKIRSVDANGEDAADGEADDE
jgi:site-specific DNA-methyltransferase (adenine-specific)